MAHLVDKSLVDVHEATDGAMRYRLLDTLREYAREWLARNGDSRKWRQAHATFFIQLAEEAERELQSSEQREWLDRLAPEGRVADGAGAPSARPSVVPSAGGVPWRLPARGGGRVASR